MKTDPIPPELCPVAFEGRHEMHRYCPVCTWVEPPPDLTKITEVASYRSKPVQIQALQLRWDTWSQMCDFIPIGDPSSGKAYGVFIDEATGDPLPVNEHSDLIGMVVPTLEGNMLARQGDWIIRGLAGEFYPCKHEIFVQKYELT